MAEIDPAWEVSIENVKRMRELGEEFLLLDVRQPEEYNVARLEGAMFIPLGDLPAALPQLGEYADRTIITLCHRGMRSLQAAVFLRQQGFERVKSMAGGIDEWSERVDPAVPRY
jgi:rhodanese-related sulfurtransferase